MKRMLLTISYDGTNYHGWQVQQNGITVQQTLQDALEKLLGKRVPLTGCSRTDAGVHAREFCCHIDCEDHFPENAFLKGLNSLLPTDISVTNCRQVQSDFHARYNAKGKKYVYQMYVGTPNPFDSRYMLHLDNVPNIDLMNKFCNGVVGTHDFAPFSSSKRTVEDTVRTVFSCFVKKDGNFITFEIEGDGFLYNMVRILAGTALSVGQNRLNYDCYDEIFTKNDRSKAGETLPSFALFLEKVFY